MDSRESELIEKYLQGQLSEADRLTVEKRIATDPDFKIELNVHQEVNQLITDSVLLSIRDQMPQWHKQNDAGSGWNASLVVGTALILIVVGLMVYQFIPQDQAITAVVPSDKIENNQLPMTVEEKKVEVVTSTFVPQQNPTVKNEEPSVTKISPAPAIVKKGIQIESSKVRIPQPQALQTRNICIDHLPSQALQFEGSCDQVSNGRITFQNFGDKSLVAFSIDSGRSYQQNAEYHMLANGVYQPAAMDNKGCLFFGAPVVLQAKTDCATEPIVINISQNESWKPAFEGQDLTIQILNANGNLVFSKTSVENQFEWNGETVNGQKLPMGIYQYQVLSAGQIKYTGNITLIK